MTNTANAAVLEAIESVLGQISTLKVASITYTDANTGANAGANAGGTLAHVAVEGGSHEILCELSDEGQLLSARVIEL